MSIKARYIVVSVREAKERGYPESEYFLSEDRNLLYVLHNDVPVRLLGADHGEPEDNSFHRDYKWVVDELNRLREYV